MRSISQYVRRHHIAMLALFVALGGTSYAAIEIPRNSGGSAQIEQGDVRASDVRARSLSGRAIKRGAIRSFHVRDGFLLPRDFRAGTLARGLLRDGGLESLRGAGPAGSQGPAGPAGPAGASRLDEQLPAARVRKDSDTQMVPEGMTVTVAFTDPTSEQYDIGGLFDPAAPTVLTIPVTGTYVLTGAVRWEGEADGVRNLNLHGPQPGGLRASSSVRANDAMVVPFGGGSLVTDTTRQSVSTTERFQAGDQVFMSVSQNDSGQTLFLDASQNQIHLSAAFVGP